MDAEERGSDHTISPKSAVLGKRVLLKGGIVETSCQCSPMLVSEQMVSDGMRPIPAASELKRVSLKSTWY